MYSFNLNEDNKKKKSVEQPVSNPPELGNATAAYETETQQKANDDDEKTGKPSYGFTYGNNNVLKNTVFASSMLEDDNAKPSAPAPATPDDKIKISSPAQMSPLWGVSDWRNSAFGDSFLKDDPRQDTPRNRDYLYSVSQDAIDDVASEYNRSGLSALYKSKLKAAKERANRSYAAYSSNPVVAMRQVGDFYDPEAILDETMREVDDARLRRMVEPLANIGGFDVDSYLKDYVKPAMRGMLLNEYHEMNKPKGGAEYVLRSSINNSNIGKVANIAFGNKQLAGLEKESVGHYDAGQVEEFAAGIGTLLVDTPVFAGIGALSSRLVGRLTSVVTDKLARRLYSYRAAEGMSKSRAFKIAERAIKSNLTNRILQNSSMNGLTLGTYDLANSVADDVLHNEGVDGGKAAGAFAKGFATGGAAGGLGTWLKKYTRGLTGGKKMLASTGVLSTESAVFTLSTEADKLMNDVEVEPVDLVNDFLHSTATLGVMKMVHWRPKGAANKLKPDGTLKDELKLSKSQQAELREMNIDPEGFMNEIERSLALPSYGLGYAESTIPKQYLEMMQSKDLSAATKAKLMYLVENKLTSTPPVAFDYGVEIGRNGQWVYTTYDLNGGKIERRLFEHAGNLKSHMLVEKSKLRKNRIAAYERELLQGIDSQNLLRQAGLYAKEKNVSVDAVAQALYNRAQNAPMSQSEEVIVREIVDRASYDQSGMVQYLSELRRGVESKYGLDDGCLVAKIDVPYYKCTDIENSALNEYEALVRAEVNSLKKGADKTRALEFREKGETSVYKGMTNDEVKSKEAVDYYTAHPDKIDAVGSGNMKEKPITIDDSESSEYVWSYEGVDNTVEDISRLRESAVKIARRFNFELEFISDERELPYPNVNDQLEVLDYNNKIRAMGWVGKDGKITINLPNIPSVEELEKTVVHECVAHGGLLKLFGNHLNNFLEEVYRKSSSDVRVAIGRMKAKYPFADNYTLIEEYLAELTEKVVLSPAERSVATDFRDFVKNSLLRLNIYTGRNRRITESDLNSILRQHSKYIEKRTPSSGYRRWVFGQFDAAKQRENTYYDREAYEQDTRAKIEGGKYFINTPEPLYNTKLLQNYELLPESKKQQVLRQWGATDGEVMELLSKIKHRFDRKNGVSNEVLGSGKLKEILDDPSFYESYPELAELPVDVVDMPGRPVSYDGQRKRLLVDRSFFDNPENSVHMSNVLKDAVQDYEGFKKAVSMNLFGINSKIGRKYNEARNVIDAIGNARRSSPDFDNNKEIDKAFEKEYGFTPDEFTKRFPSLDEYTIYKLTGNEVPFRDDFVSKQPETEKQHSGSVVNDLGNLMKYLNGPLDIVYQKLQQVYSDDYPQTERVNERVPENDYGYSEFRRVQDGKRKRLRDILGFRKWRDAFRHLDDELNELN